MGNAARDYSANGNAWEYFTHDHYTTLGYGDLVLPREWRLLGRWRD